MARYIDADKIVIEEIPLKDHEIIKANNCVFIGRTNGKQIKQIKDYLKNMIDKAPTEDVVPRSEVEEIVKFKDMAYAELKSLFIEAKQEVAKQIFEEIEKLILNETTKSRTIIKDGVNRCFSDYLEGQLVMLRKLPVWIAELKKKYIGENSNV